MNIYTSRDYSLILLKSVLALLILLAVVNVSVAHADGIPEDVAVIESQKIVNLNTTIIGKNVQINWSSYSADAKAFNVEVATEAGETGELIFTSIGKVELTEDFQYKFVDETPEKVGLRYYRVRQISKSGSDFLSEVETANFLFHDSFTINVRPDANLASVELDINANSAGEAVIEIEGVTANYTQTQVVDVKDGFNTTEIELADQLEPGMYTLSVEYNGNTQVVLLQKDSSTDMMVTNEK